MCACKTHIEDVHPSNPERAVRLLGGGAYDNLFAIDHDDVAFAVGRHDLDLILRRRHCRARSSRKNFGAVV